MSEEIISLLYDPVLRRPGCVLLQAVAGTDRTLFDEFFAGADNWLTAPTENMRMMSGTRAQWEREIAEAAAS